MVTGRRRWRRTCTGAWLAHLGAEVLIGAGAGAALGIAGGIVGASAGGAAASTGGSALADFAAEGGATLGDFAAQGSNLGEFAEGSSLGDFAAGPGATLGDFAAKEPPAPAAAPAPPPSGRPRPRLPNIPAAIGAAVVTVGVIAGGLTLAGQDSGKPDAVEEASSETDAPDTPASSAKSSPAAEAAAGVADIPFLFACGGEGNSGPRDGGLAVGAACHRPADVEVAPDGTVYILDSAQVGSTSAIRVVNLEGKIRSFDLPAVDGKEVSHPTALTRAPDGTIYIADFDNRRILRRSAEGDLTTFAGNGSTEAEDPPVDGRPAKTSPLGNINSLALDRAGNLYLTDDQYNVVQKIDPSGMLTIAIGGGSTGSMEDGAVPVRDANLTTLLGGGHTVVDFSPEGVLHVGDETNIYRVEGGALVHVAGTGEFAEPQEENGNGGAAAEARIWLQDMAFGPDGTLYVAEAQPVADVRTIDANGIIRRFAGGDSPAPSLPPTSTSFSPSGIDVDKQGRVYLTESGTSYEIVRRLPAGGVPWPLGTLSTSGADLVGRDLGPSGRPDATFGFRLDGDVIDLVLAVCSADGKPTSHHWDTIAGPRPIPPGYAFERGDQTWVLGIADTKNRIYNQSDGSLPTDLIAGDYVLHAEDDGSLVEGAVLCFTVLREGGATTTHRVPVPEKG